MTRRWQRIISWSLFGLLTGVAGIATIVLAQAPEAPVLTERTGVSLNLLASIAGLLLVIAGVVWDTRIRAIQAMPENKALRTFITQEQHAKVILALQEQNTRDHGRIETAIEHLSTQLAERRNN